MTSRKQSPPSVRILKVTKYKGFGLLIQYLTKAHIFQVILSRNTQFWQAHNYITPDESKKAHSDDDLVKCGMLLYDVGMQIADAIIKEESGSKKKVDLNTVN